jgi:hypothetical protein
MADKYAVVVSQAGAVSQDPDEIDTNVTADSGATAEAELASADGGGGVAVANKGFAGANAILLIGTYVDDADGSIGTLSEFAPGHGTNTKYANEKLAGMNMGGIVPGGEFASGTLTIGEEVGGDKSVGGLVIEEAVTEGDQFTIDTQEYTLKATPTVAYDIDIGANEAATKVNIVAAINASGTEGVEYFAGTLIHPTIEATAFVGDDCVLTAREFGVAEDGIVTAETGQGLTDVANIFAGASTANAEAIDTMTIGAFVYRFMEIGVQAFDINVGADEAATKVNIVAAINLSGTPGVEYAVGTTENDEVSAAAFATDACLITAKAGGTEGDEVVFEETFDHTSNVMNGSGTLGGDDSGIDFENVTSLEPVGISADVALKDQN